MQPRILHIVTVNKATGKVEMSDGHDNAISARAGYDETAKLLAKQEGFKQGVIVSQIDPKPDAKEKYLVQLSGNKVHVVVVAINKDDKSTDELDIEKTFVQLQKATQVADLRKLIQKPPLKVNKTAVAAAAVQSTAAVLNATMAQLEQRGATIAVVEAKSDLLKLASEDLALTAEALKKAKQKGEEARAAAAAAKKKAATDNDGCCSCGIFAFFKKCLSSNTSTANEIRERNEARKKEKLLTPRIGGHNGYESLN